jgi:uncharacterized protein YukE
MQKAYASYQLTQLIGRFSSLLGKMLQVWKGESHPRFAFVGAIRSSSEAIQPVS